MPAYFYHLSLQLLSYGLSDAPGLQGSSLALQSAWEALQPFQQRSRSSTSNGLSPGDSKNPLPGHTLADRQKVISTLSTHSTLTPLRTTPSASSSTSSSTTTLLEDDKRFGAVSIECIDMVTPKHPSKRTSKRGSVSTTEPENLVAAGIGTDILGGLRTKGRYIPLDYKLADSVWGIVHLYRDSQETPYLGNDDEYPAYLKGSSAAARHPGEQQATLRQGLTGAGGAKQPETAGLAEYPFPETTSSSAQSPDEDCTTLCILAVPSYLSPPDFLGFIGQKTMDDVSHFRMIRTARANRYMVLMKFRSGRKAKEWQKEWNGHVFNSIEPETCHVVFVKTVEIQVVDAGTPSEQGTLSSNLSTPSRPPVSSTGQATLTGKPLAPPTPALIELPTCPVCLERMDETTGLLTINCQHVFHCTCLQKWKGSGCPVCRYTQDDYRKSNASPKPDEEPQECSICHSEENLWACLICGTVGCGRYDNAHAFAHWKETSHAFSMDLTSQRVWDYAGDAYVHRIIQNKTDGKLLELPAADHSALDPPDWGDAVPREKLENMSIEYTHLLTSQLESQRAYFEEVVERAVDKASQASAAAAVAEVNASNASSRLEELQTKYDAVTIETLPSLEHDRARAEKRAEKFEALARSFEKGFQEEKAMNRNMLLRLEGLAKEVDELKVANADLAEQNRDLTFFISGTQRLQGQGEEVEQGTVSVPEPPSTSTKKRRGKGKR
ncbi:BRCA1-associated 2 [Penicillium cf. griseofulvum]|uniref:BRCA1-associated 2 n=1 Tax=Penicillium cf. griseofulvum TaxID=2972120 RepID=A0A9W9M4S0_9EURO|nr:BRCA1-associated 2 [Penicillium cf. griseofulvum]